MNSIALAYAGVHEIFQLALAAHEMGELEALHCSAVDLRSKWGALLVRHVSMPSARPLGWQKLPPECVHEFPWPLLCHRLTQRLVPRRRSEHLHTNDWFDRIVAHRLALSNARLFVGGETCALHSFKVAKERGMKSILDCAGIPNRFLEEQECRAAANLSLDFKRAGNSATMQERKRRELELADVVLCCSAFQRDVLDSLHPEIKRIEIIPLWADVDFWGAVAGERVFSPPGQPLRVLCAGAVSLRKGVPYLLEAVESLSKEVSLTLVGSLSAEIKGILKGFRPHRHLPYVTKLDLRDLYREHDVLVMPTLGDSFGFVTVEAMASGMPVIASRNAGAPVPDESWRVPPHDAAAIREKLLAYHADRERLRHDGEVARAFAAQFTPERYRARVGELFKELLAS